MALPSFLTSILSGVWGYVAASVLAAGLATGATHFIDAKAYGATIATLKLQQAQTQAASVSASLAKLTGFISTMNAAAASYQGSLDAINANFAAINKGLKNAIASRPLPADCRPDTSRLSSLTAAYAAANHTPAP